MHADAVNAGLVPIGTPVSLDLGVPARPAPDQAAMLAMQLSLLTAEMRRYARRKIRDEALAEDTVQDALVAALGSLGSFQGASSLKTWVLGILTHKIQDAFRRETRYVRLSTSVDDGSDDYGSFGEPVADESSDPMLEVARRRMLSRVVSEVESLPDSLRQVFLLQAVEGLPTERVCAELGITESNCWVRLHRARKRLSTLLVDHR